MVDVYAARCQCGQIVGGIVKRADRDEVADTVAEWIREDLEIETMTVEAFRERFGSCQCEEENHVGKNPLLPGLS